MHYNIFCNLLATPKMSYHTLFTILAMWKCSTYSSQPFSDVKMSFYLALQKARRSSAGGGRHWGALGSSGHNNPPRQPSQLIRSGVEESGKGGHCDAPECASRPACLWWLSIVLSLHLVHAARTFDGRGFVMATVTILFPLNCLRRWGCVCLFNIS